MNEQNEDDAVIDAKDLDEEGRLKLLSGKKNQFFFFFFRRADECFHTSICMSVICLIPIVVNILTTDN